MRLRALRGWKLAAATTTLVIAVAGPVSAWHYAKWGWNDRHFNYPTKPSGYWQLYEEFGEPCSERTHAKVLGWRAWDNGRYYNVYFHRRLGWPASSNLENDVRGHIANQHLDQYVKSGIWGYNCRFIAGTYKWSTHAWGIAVDLSSRYEPYGRCWSSVNRHHADIWKNHRWTWGLSFCDPMHFQYANNV
ncbi:MAG TPA: M15 family metallopeptidase [Actinomycetota bacterium]|nr:M15 family metallopeptidase [Actinomycetota bacterium]